MHGKEERGGEAGNEALYIEKRRALCGDAETLFERVAEVGATLVRVDG